MYTPCPIGHLWSMTQSTGNIRGSVDSLGESGVYQHPPRTEPAKPPEEVFVVELHREVSEKLGLTLIGGVDNPSLETVHVSVLYLMLTFNRDILLNKQESLAK